MTKTEISDQIGHLPPIRSIAPIFGTAKGSDIFAPK